MRGEERFAILGVLVLIFLVVGLIGGINGNINYSPVDTTSNNFMEESQFKVYSLFDKIENFLFKLSQNENRNYIIFFLIGLLVLLFLAIILRFFKREKSKPSIKSDILDRAISTVNNLRSRGYNDLVIRQMFLEKGWSEKNIDLIMI